MIDSRDFYVYLISRSDGTPCYIGKGKGYRVLKHAWRSTNPHLANIYAQAGGILPVQKLAENLTEAEAFDLERKLIASYGREPSGPLVNMTDGGEGISGYKFSDDVTKRMALGKIGNKYRLGMKTSPETKQKQRAAKLGRSLSPEHRAAIGAAHKGRIKSPEECAAISAGKTGKPRRKYNWSEEAKRRQSERFRDPELRAKIGAGTVAGIRAARGGN